MKSTLALPLALLLSAAAVPAAPPPDLQARLDAWRRDQSGGVALAWVDRDGATLLQSGRLDGPDSPAITADTPFEIGSVTKVFTAILLAEAERQGKVRRDDPAAAHLLPAGDPALAALGRVTLLSLATHTSGLPRLPFNLGPNPDGNPDPYAAYDRAMLVAALRQHGPVAPAGQSVAYSNFGAAVLGEAVASAWGTTYADALQRHVLTPLGLKATTVGLAGTLPPDGLAPGHAGGRRVPNWTFQAMAPAGALRSTTRDLATFLAACLASDGPLRPALAASFAPQRAAEDVGGRVALGWFLTNDAERPVTWHNGATAGSHAFVGFCPATGTGVALLANLQQGLEELGFGLLGTKPSRPQVDTVANAADYVGRFPLAPTFAIDITQQGGRLRGQATGQPPFALRPVGPDRFALVGVPAEISFERGGDGQVAALVLHQNGLDQRAPRGALPPPPAEVTLPAETLAEYAGSYPLAPTFVLTITVENGALFVQATGQPKLPVFASAKDEFFYKVVPARISFQRDPTGTVTGLVLRQNGRDMPAKKAP